MERQLEDVVVEKLRVLESRAARLRHPEVPELLGRDPASRELPHRRLLVPHEDGEDVRAHAVLELSRKHRGVSLEELAQQQEVRAALPADRRVVEPLQHFHRDARHADVQIGDIEADVPERDSVQAKATERAAEAALHGERRLARRLRSGPQPLEQELERSTADRPRARRAKPETIELRQLTRVPRQHAAVRHGQRLVETERREVAEGPERPAGRFTEQGERAVLDEQRVALAAELDDVLHRLGPAEIVDDVDRARGEGPDELRQLFEIRLEIAPDAIEVDPRAGRADREDLVGVVVVRHEHQVPPGAEAEGAEQVIDRVARAVEVEPSGRVEGKRQRVRAG